MIPLQCPILGCSYATSEMSETVAYALLAANTPVHTSASTVGAANHSSGPKLERPKVDVGNIKGMEYFHTKLGCFRHRVKFEPASQLFQCAGETLGNMLLKCDPFVISKPTS